MQQQLENVPISRPLAGACYIPTRSSGVLHLPEEKVCVVSLPITASWHHLRPLTAMSIITHQAIKTRRGDCEGGI